MKKQQLNLYIKIKPLSTGETKKLVKVIKTIEVAGNQCFFYKNNKQFELIHLRTGRLVYYSGLTSFKHAETAIMEKVANNLESIEKAFKNRSGDYEIINN
jgi:hypothetical protein